MTQKDKNNTVKTDDDDVYELFKRGLSLLESRDYAQATIPLEKAKSLEPDKGSIREALGRAYFHSRKYQSAVDEFESLIELDPVNDYAHFCLGRSLQKLGMFDQARRYLSLASHLRPDRSDYRAFSQEGDSKNQ